MQWYWKGKDRLLDSVPKRLLTVPVRYGRLLIALPIFSFAISPLSTFFLFSPAHCITVWVLHIAYRAGVDAAPISVIAATERTILWLEGEKLLHPCCNACGFHQQLLFNVIQLLARKNVLFHQKLEITAKRTTREKLLAYLFQQAKQENSNTFVIPYDRQGLASPCRSYGITKVLLFSCFACWKR